MAAGKIGPNAPTDKGKFLWAEGQQESGGDYGAVNANSGALGRWQVMPYNLRPWARQCGLRPVRPAWFLNHPAYQDDLAWCVLGGYFDAYGPRGAASMWYSGQPDWHETYGNPPVYVYVNSVMAIYTGAQGQSAQNIPPPPAAASADYSPVVRRSAAQLVNVARHAAWHAALIDQIGR